MAFKYLISECYSRDMSMKTKSAKYAKMRRGEYQSVICPYGYQKSTDGRMEPNEEVAGIVRQIFQWAAEGNTAAEITRKLYALKIPTPGEYRKSKGKNYYNVSRAHGVWSSSTVLRILADQRYIGTYVIGKQAVREIGSRRVRRKNDPAWFCCRHSEAAESFPCHGLQVKACELEQAIFDTLRVQIHSALGVDATKDKLNLQSLQEAEHEKKLRALQDGKRQIYEQYALGEIDLETYKARKEEFDIDLVKEKNVHTAIAAQIKKAQSDYEAKVKRDEIIQEITSANSLTNSLVDLLIKKVYVFPENRIEIEYVTQDFFVTAEIGKEA